MIKNLLIAPFAFMATLSAKAEVTVVASIFTQPDQYCSRYFNMLETEQVIADVIVTTQKIYDKIDKDSPRKQEIKERIESFTQQLERTQELKYQMTRREVGVVKLLLSQDVEVELDLLIDPDGELEVSPSIDMGNSILISAGSVQVRAIGAMACEHFQTNGGDIKASALKSIKEAIK